MSNIRILVVEDDSIVALAIQNNLKRLGYSVPNTVSTGEEAIQQAAETPPNLVLMDIKLQGELDGIAAAEQIYTRFSIPVVYLTAYADDETLRRAKDTKPFGYLVKPYEPRELHATIEMALYKHEMEKKLRESEERYRRLVESLERDYLFYSHNTEGVFTYVSPSITNVLGYTQEDFTIHYTEYLTDNPVNKKVERHTELSIKGEKQLPYEVELIHKNHDTRLLEVTEVPVFDEQGNVIAVEGIAHDITERKQAEETLREREEMIRALVETSQDWVWSIDVQGIHTYCNPAVETILGYRPDELVGKLSLDLIHAEDRVQIEANLPEWIKEERGWHNQLIRWLHKDGDYRYLESNAVPILNVAGELIGFRGMDRDITERKQVEEALRESEKRFQTLAAAAFEGIAFTEQGMVLDANQQFADILGYGMDELMGSAVRDLVVPEDLEFVESRILAGSEAPYEHRALRKDGTMIYIEVCHRMMSVGERSTRVTAVRDITERKQAEEALQENEKRFQTLADATFEGIVFLDQGMVIDANQQFADIFGYDMDEVLDLTVRDLVAPEEQEFVEGRIFAGSEDPYEIRAIRKDGTMIFIEVRPRMMSVGERSTRVTAVRDITERKKAEETLRESLQTSADIVQAIPAGLFIYQYEPPDRLILLDGNPEAEHLTGITAKDWGGKEFNEIWPQAREVGVTQAYLDVVKTGKTYETEDLHYVDDRIEGAFRIRAFSMPAKRLGVAFEDITERKQAEESLQRYAGRLQILHEIDQAILAAQSAEATARAVLGYIRQLVAPCQRASVLTFDHKAREVSILGADIDAQIKPVKQTRFEFDEFAIVEELQQDKVYVVADILALSDPTPLGQLMHKTGIRSYINVPLFSADQLIGSLNLGASVPDAFTSEHIDIAREAANSLAIAITQANLQEQIQQHTEGLEHLIADRTRELSVLYEVTAIANEGQDLQTILARSLDRILAAMSSNAGTIHLLDETDSIGGERHFRLVVQQGLPAEFVPQIETMPAGKGLGGYVIEHSEPLLVTDIASDPRVPEISYVGDPYMYMGMPMRAGGRVVGVLSILREQTASHFNVEEITLLTSIADQMGVVVESVRLQQQAEQAVVMEERARLARELHDSVTQLLYSMNLFAKSGQNAYHLGDQDELEVCLTELGENAQQALKEMRLLVYELRPPILEQDGLIGALQNRLDTVEGRVGIKTQLLTGTTVEIPPKIEGELYHIALEALNNSLKHAQATEVTVKIDRVEAQVKLEIIDNGSGFDPETTKGSGGLGLGSMRERTEKLGGILTFTTEPDKGTAVWVSVDLEGIVVG